MFLDKPPLFPDDYDEEIGYRSDYKGLGVFVYRSEARDKWVSNLNKNLIIYEKYFYSILYRCKTKGLIQLPYQETWIS